jgi:hypothetical protein
LTYDRWENEASYREFRRAYAREYDELDRSCMGLTDEREIGTFFVRDALDRLG